MPERRRARGHLQIALQECDRTSWMAEVEHLARQYLSCPRVRAIIRTIQDKYQVDPDDLKQDAWLVFAARILPVLDSPANVYTALYACVDNCARSLLHERKELPLNAAMGSDPDLLAASLLEAGQDWHGAEMAEQLALAMDKRKAQQRLETLWQLHGWPADIPRHESAYRAPGRPRKDRHAGHRQQALADTQDKAESRAGALQPMALMLHEVRRETHLPIKKFASEVGVKVQTLRALLYGILVNEEMAAHLAQTGREVLVRMRRDPVLKKMLDQSMRAIVGDWQAMLASSGPRETMKSIAALTGKNISTLLRWHADDRKPVDIHELAEIERRLAKNAA